MCIEYNECHYGGMYNINVKIIFVITEIVHMNAGVSFEKEKVKESQSQSRSVTPPLDTPSGAGLGASHVCTNFKSHISLWEVQCVFQYFERMT